MTVEILKVIPAALVAAVNVTALLVLIAVLSWSKRAGIALVVAFGVVFLVFGLLMLGLGLTIPDDSGSPVSGIIDLCLAGLLYVVGDAVFLLILMAPMVAPLIVVYAFPRTSDKALGRLSAFLVRHGHFLMGAMSTGFAVYLTVKGVVEIRPFV